MKSGWEYNYIQASTLQIVAVTDVLNEWGQDGWEVVGFASSDRTIGINALVIIVKRPRELLDRLAEGTAEGWYPDPSGRHPDRHWDGARWTKWARDKEGGTRTEDPPYGAVISN